MFRVIFLSLQSNSGCSRICFAPFGAIRAAATPACKRRENRPSAVSPLSRWRSRPSPEKTVPLRPCRPQSCMSSLPHQTMRSRRGPRPRPEPVDGGPRRAYSAAAWAWEKTRQSAPSEQDRCKAVGGIRAALEEGLLAASGHNVTAAPALRALAVLPPSGPPQLTAAVAAPSTPSTNVHQVTGRSARCAPPSDQTLT